MKLFQGKALFLLFLVAILTCEYTNDMVWSMYIPAMLLTTVFMAQARLQAPYTPSLRHPEVWGAVIGLIALPAISIAGSPDPYISLIETLGYGLLFALLLVIAATPVSSTRGLPAAAGIAMLPFVVQGVHQVWTTGVNAHGGMHDSNLYAGYLTAATAAVVALGISEYRAGRSKQAYATHALGAILFVGAYAGHSRGAWVALTFAVATTLWATKRQTALKNRYIVAVVAAIAMVGLVCTGHKTEHDIAQHDRYGTSTNSRLAMWNSTVHMIEDHPVAGVGFGLWHLAYPQYRTSADEDSAGFHAHNDYLEAWASGGVVGGLVVLGIPCLWILALWRASRSELSDPWSFVGVSVASGILIMQAVVNFIYHDLSPAMLVGVTLGSMFAQTRSGRHPVAPGRGTKVRWSLITLAATTWTLVMYLSMTPTLILASPHGFEGRYLGKLMDTRTLLFLARINPFAADPLFTVGQEKMLDGIVEKDVAKKQHDFQLATRYFLDAEKRQGIQAGTTYKRAMLALLMPGMGRREQIATAEEELELSLSRNPAYWPSVNAYVRLMAEQKTPDRAIPVLNRAAQASPIYQRRNFTTLRSELVSGQLAQGALIH